VKQIERLTAENTELKARALPENSVAVPKDHAALLESYRPFGDPESIKTRLEQADADAQALTSITREKALRAACETARIDFETLSDIPGIAELNTRIEETSVNGKLTKTAVIVTTEGDKETTTELRAYLTAKYPRLATMLFKEQATNPLPRRVDSLNTPRATAIRSEEPFPGLMDKNGRKPSRVRI
jgi:hypothetical protein